MKMLSNGELIKLIRQHSPERIASELVSVQPIPNDAYKNLVNSGLSEEELIAQGYEPVSSTGLLWIKKIRNNDE